MLLEMTLVDYQFGLTDPAVLVWAIIVFVGRAFSEVLEERVVSKTIHISYRALRSGMKDVAALYKSIEKPKFAKLVKKYNFEMKTGCSGA